MAATPATKTARGIRRGLMSCLPTLPRDFSPTRSAAFPRHPAARGFDTLEHAQLLEVLGDLRVLRHQTLPVDRVPVRDRRGHRDQDRILLMLLVVPLNRATPAFSLVETQMFPEWSSLISDTVSLVRPELLSYWVQLVPSKRR